MRRERPDSTREQRAAEMRRIVDDYSASVLSLAAYCRSRGVSVSTFHYWRRRRPAPFVEVEVVAAGAGREPASSAGAGGGPAAGAGAAPAIEIAAPGGAVIRLRRDVDDELLRRVLRAASTPC
jgi:hypothetical protein